MGTIDEEMANNYHIDIDNINESLWTSLLLQFADASITQTWTAGSINYGKNNLSHLLLRKGNDIVGMAQVGIKRIPILKTGTADIQAGPLWKKKNMELNPDYLIKILDAAKIEFAVKRGLLLRIWPCGFEEHDNEIKINLQKCGFIPNSAIQSNRTLLLNLTPKLEELRQNLARKWRQALGRAERLSSIQLECGNTEEHYEIAFKIYKEMHNRKQFSLFVDMEKQGLINKNLPELLKLKILICRMDGEPIAALGWSTVGDIGLPLIAATGNKAIASSTNASNLLWWKMLEDMKEQGCIICDVGGIDEQLNPGGYKFKSGFVGTSGKEVKYLGQYYIHNNWRAQLLHSLIDKTKHLRKRISAHRVQNKLID